MSINLAAGWLGVFAGCLAGAAQGLYFHREAWMGGYGSWRRRMLRLAHISFFGIGFLNIALAVTAPSLVWPSRLMVGGAVGMPLVCYLAALDDRWRRLFPLPALSVIAAAGMTAWQLAGP